MSKFVLLISILVGPALLTGCQVQDSAMSEPKILRIAVLPDQSPKILEDRYAPLFSYLTQATGLPLEIVYPETYEELVFKFVTGEVDIAYFGGVSFVQAEQAGGAIPLVMRDLDRRFTSYFIAHADAPETNLQDFQNLDIAFGSRTSTSGHLMPRAFLEQQDIDVDSFFSDVRYTGKHDATGYAVQEKDVSLGAINAIVFESMLADGRLNPGQIKIIRETPPYTNYVWAIRPDVEESQRINLMEAFLALSISNSTDAAILEKLEANHFIPAKPSDFDRLRNILARIPDDPGVQR